MGDYRGVRIPYVTFIFSDVSVLVNTGVAVMDSGLVY